MKSRVLRIIDANANRLTEGLRVCEDIARFILSHRAATRRFKSLRHRVFLALKEITKDRRTLETFRNVGGDIGKGTTPSEKRRGGVTGIFRANIKRSEESMRVLEEFSKLSKPVVSQRFKRMRFELYSLEKNIIERLQAVRNPRQGCAQK